jgi:hypothetical protein
MRGLINGLRADYRKQAEENRKFREEMRQRYVTDVQRMNELIGNLTESLQRAIYDVAGTPETRAAVETGQKIEEADSSTENSQDGEGASEAPESNDAPDGGSEGTSEATKQESALPTAEIRAQVAALRLELVHLQSMLEATQAMNGGQ